MSRNLSANEVYLMWTLMMRKQESFTLKLIETEPRLLVRCPPKPVARLTAGPFLADTLFTSGYLTNRAVSVEYLACEHTQT